MTENDVLDAAIDHCKEKGWTLTYRTKRLVKTAQGGTGAQGGTDAILIQEDPRRFRFIEAKGDETNKAKKSAGFTNCLGATLKRIRVKKGYLSNEAKARFTPPVGFTVEQFRRLLVTSATLENSEYVMALPRSLEETLKSCLDPDLAKLLHIKVLMVEEQGATEHAWEI